MANQVTWEWAVETYINGDVEGDIDTLHENNLADALNDFDPDDTNQRLVLICDIGNDYEGLVERGWAYVTDGILPESAVDSYDRYVRKVPAKIRREFERAMQPN